MEQGIHDSACAERQEAGIAELLIVYMTALCGSVSPHDSICAVCVELCFLSSSYVVYSNAYSSEKNDACDYPDDYLAEQVEVILLTERNRSLFSSLSFVAFLSFFILGYFFVSLFGSFLGFICLFVGVLGKVEDILGCVSCVFCKVYDVGSSLLSGFCRLFSIFTDLLCSFGSLFNSVFCVFCGAVFIIL